MRSSGAWMSVTATEATGTLSARRPTPEMREEARSAWGRRAGSPTGVHTASQAGSACSGECCHTAPRPLRGGAPPAPAGTGARAADSRTGCAEAPPGPARSRPAQGLSGTVARRLPHRCPVPALALRFTHRSASGESGECASRRARGRWRHLPPPPGPWPCHA